ncbi:MAG: hypothetical protein WAW37_10915 [Syntrophobacteraceae bacterium]
MAPPETARWNLFVAFSQASCATRTDNIIRATRVTRGVTGFYRRMFSIVVTSTDVQRSEWLDEVRRDMDAFFP